jgi:ribonuclease HI
MSSSKKNILYHVFFDGACKGNPGPVGCGYYIAANKKHVGSGYKWIGKRDTNNVAEYTGLIIALERLHQLSLEPLSVIQIQGDSMLVINQMNKKWKCKKPHLIPLMKEAQSLLIDLQKKYTVLPLKHVFREYNKEADKLANHAVVTQSTKDN